MSYDALPTHIVSGDQNAGHNVVAENQKGATDAMQKQVQEAQFGFLNGMTTAIGGTASRPEMSSEKEAKIKPSDLATHNEAVTFGLANEGAGVKQDQSALSEHFRQISFESVYASAVNNPRNQSGMPGRDSGSTRPLDFNAPQLATAGNGQQLRWAS